MNLLDQLEEQEFSHPGLLPIEEIVRLYEEDRPARVAIDTETTGLAWAQPNVFAFAISLSWSKKRTFYVPLNQDETDEAAARFVYRMFLECELLDFYNAKFDLHILAKLLRRFDLPLVTRKIRDGMLLHYCLDEQAHHGLKEVSGEKGIRFDRNVDADELRARVTAWREAEAKMRGIHLDEIGYEDVPLRLMVPYAVSDAYVTLETNMQLERDLEKQLETGRKGRDVRDIYELEMDYLWVVFSKEERGMRVDRDHIASRIGELTPVLQENKDRMRDTLGWDINPLSTDDVAEALRSRGVDGSSWVNKRTGRDKLPEWVLQDLIDHQLTTEDVRQLCQDVLEYRGNTKLLTTYFQPLLRQAIVDAHGQAIVFPNVKQHGARTGRQSVTDPPLQTLPRDAMTGVRESFIAREGHVLIFADYSQQELRILSHYMSAIGYHQMTEIYLRGGDVHWETAESVFGKPRIELASHIHRQKAKDVNFGTVYGMGIEKAALLLAGNVAEGKKFLNKYHSTFPGIRALKRACESAMVKREFIVTAFGRRHRLKNKGMAYKAVNSLVQGTGADLTKWAMVRLNERFVAEGMRAQILLSVHDEIICEAPEDEADEAARIIPEVMCSFELLCPLEADVKVGRRWSKD